MSEIRRTLAPLVAAPLALCLVVLALRSRRTRAGRGGGLLAISIVLLAVSVGCGPAVIGGLAAGLASSGGGGGSGSVAAVARYQVALEPRVDVAARGSASSAPAILESPSEIIQGPLFEVRAAAP